MQLSQDAAGAKPEEQTTRLDAERKIASLLRIGLTPKNEPSGAPVRGEEPSTPQFFFS